VKERLITLAGGFAALAIVIMLVWSPTPSEDEKISHPTTQDRGNEGLAVAKRWLEAGKVPTLSLRDRYDTLAGDPSLPDRGNLLVTVLPHTSFTRQQEDNELLAWISRGNTILVLAAYSDSPRWSTHAEGNSVDGFLQMLGFDLDVNYDDEDEESSLPSLQKNQPRNFSGAAHPLTQDLKRVVVRPRDERELTWELTGSYASRRPLALLFYEPAHLPVFWQTRVGEGTVWISSYSNLFGNAALGEGDNARLLERMVNHSVAPGGRVIFDDMHQGLSDLYDAKAFFADERLLHTVFFILALWVVYLLGYTNRFIPVRTKKVVGDLAAETRIAGGVFARHVADHAVARRLLNHFHHEIRAMHHMPADGEPAWDLLARNARINPQMLATLQREQQRAEAHKSVDLLRLTQLMTDVRKALQ
jgi:hypothetical protein